MYRSEDSRLRKKQSINNLEGEIKKYLLAGMKVLLFLFSILFFHIRSILQQTYNIKNAKIYLINLKERTDKLKTSKFQLDLLGLNFSVVEAINGTLLKSKHFKPKIEDVNIFTGIKNLKTTLKIIKSSKRTPGQIGCWLSHLKALDIIIQNDDSMSLILEDDFVADGNAIDLMNKYISQLSKDLDWDLLYVGHCDAVQRCSLFLDKTKKLCFTNVRVNCLHGYVLKNKKVAETLFKAGNLLKPVNADQIFELSKAKRFMAFPPIFKQRKNIKADVASKSGIHPALLNNTIEVIINKLL